MTSAAADDQLLRAAGAALDALADPPSRTDDVWLRPDAAIAALLAGARALFSTAGEGDLAALSRTLRAEGEAVSCTFQAFVPAGQAELRQTPMPSWCAHLAARGLLQRYGKPVVPPSRASIERAMRLVVIRDGRRQRLCFRFAAPIWKASHGYRLHAAISPSHLSNDWRGPFAVRVALTAAAGGPRLSIQAGAPRLPGMRASVTVEGEGAVTWVVHPRDDDPTLTGPRGDGGAWPLGWPRWLVVRVQTAGKDPWPTALWELPELWAQRELALGRRRQGEEARGAGGASRHGAPAARASLGVDLGSRSTAVASLLAAGAELPGLLTPSQPLPSGFALLLGEPADAALHGCGETLEQSQGQLPTALELPGAAALRALLLGPLTDRAALQAWLPQQRAVPSGEGATLRLELFKNPDLLKLGHSMEAIAAALPELPPAASAEQASRALLKAYGLLLGHAIAVRNAAPGEDAGSIARPVWPSLGELRVALTYPRLRWSAGAAAHAVSFADLYREVATDLCRALGFAWPQVEGPHLISDPDAAMAGLRGADLSGDALRVIADLGGLTLQVTVELLAQPGRPAPLIPGSTSTYLLGGERWLQAAAYAAAATAESQALPQRYRAELSRLRAAVTEGAPLGEGPLLAPALAVALEEKLAALIGRQIAATLERAAPRMAGLQGGGVQLYLLGDGWKLAELAEASAAREEQARARFSRWAQLLLRQAFGEGAEFPPVSVARRTKQELCMGAIACAGPPPREPHPLPALHLVEATDASGARLHRFVAVAGEGQGDAALLADEWFLGALGAPEGQRALLAPEQWLTAGAAAAFADQLRGAALRWSAAEPLLEQWIRVCGPSLLALQLYRALRASPETIVAD